MDVLVYIVRKIWCRVRVGLISPPPFHSSSKKNEVAMKTMVYQSCSVMLLFVKGGVWFFLCFFQRMGFICKYMYIHNMNMTECLALK